MAEEAAIATLQTPGGAAKVGAGETWKASRGQLRRMLAAGLLGAAVFLVQAGAIEIILRSDRMCRETRAVNWAFNARGCQSEGVGDIMRGLSYGILGALRPDLPAALGVFTMAVILGGVASLLGLLPLREGILAFLLIEAAAAVAFGFLGYILPYLG